MTLNPIEVDGHLVAFCPEPINGFIHILSDHVLKYDDVWTNTPSAYVYGDHDRYHFEQDVARDMINKFKVEARRLFALGVEMIIVQDASDGRYIGFDNKNVHYTLSGMRFGGTVGCVTFKEAVDML